MIEYKVGANDYQKHAIDQVLDYALDLKNFHEGSHNRTIVPILVATKAPARQLRGAGMVGRRHATNPRQS